MKLEAQIKYQKPNVLTTLLLRYSPVSIRLTQSLRSHVILHVHYILTNIAHMYIF